MLDTMPQIGKDVTSMALPGTELRLRTTYVRTRDIPGLFAIMAIDRSADAGDGTDGTLLTPPARLCTRQNEDGTLAVLTDLRMLAPEARHSAASFVETTIFTFDPEHRESQIHLETFLARVLPARQAISTHAVTEDCLKGRLDGVVGLHSGPDSDPQEFVPFSMSLVEDQLKRSTFQAAKKKSLESASKPEEKEEEKENSETQQALTQEKNEVSNPQDEKTNTSDGTETAESGETTGGEQWELFAAGDDG